jgi:SAM-dependent methyltransferase
MRRYILKDLADGMRVAYEAKVAPRFLQEHGRAPRDGVEVHRSIKDEPLYQFYSSMRCQCQEMVWRSVLPTVERNAVDLAGRARELDARSEVGGKLELDPEFTVPKSISALDIHLMPGCYDTEYMDEDVSMGAVYDNGGTVFSAGLLGDRRDDIGGSISYFISRKYPEFEPRTIVDLGCGIGTNTLPWARTYPDAQVHAVDVAAPLLRYGHARACSENTAVHFRQGDAVDGGFPDNSVDLVFSSMLLHEVPPKSVPQLFANAYRMLRPGGLMLHMELPPNDMTGAYDSFYLDWDSYYNKEPFYKPFRDMHLQKVCQGAGFDPEKYVQFIIPSEYLEGREAIDASLDQQANEANENTGRLSDAIQWFCFGVWK